ncbi:uncharacterized protein LY89DRAFT_637035 [Mollisia scopiformis]|uniref:Uncharacterized protein n=1 Tax=Mollisia scopiformis TaxID=149040 RepID=A0A194XRT3_MOLSC|nr:uncharacterized protein LY89DRAFT_637035 [Mollisia scopiformis]KUJ22759.1 hypothetical protein LY89DRAFT_637035 [Mollisia scopiformis]
MSNSPHEPDENHADISTSTEEPNKESNFHPPSEMASPSSPPAPTPKKPSAFQRTWNTLNLNPTVITIMIKPAIAATISMAIYQSHDVAKHYLNLGYLMIIISITTVPILPRGKFLMNLVISMFLTLFGIGMVTLGQYCGIKARQHTTPANAPLAIANGYNSSASAVNAIFFMINIFAISTLRAARPAFSIPAIQYTILICVGFAYGPQEPTISASHRFIKELLYAFLTGQGISAAVCLFIIPVSSRKVFFAESKGFLMSCRSLLKKQVDFIKVLRFEKVDGDLHVKEKAKALKEASTGILSLGAKLREDVLFAKRESAMGHFRETDISELHGLLRRIMIPISGLATIVEISEGMQEEIGEQGVGEGEDRKEWTDMLSKVRDTFEGMVEILDESLLHVLILLGFVPASTRGSSTREEDVEKGAGTLPRAGEVGFGDHLEQRIKEFRRTRTEELKRWAGERGLNSVFRSGVKGAPPSAGSEIAAATSRDILASKRLHIIMFMEYLLWSTSLSILSLVLFSEQKSTSKTTHLILPKLRTLKKWLFGLLSGDPSSSSNLTDPDPLTISSEIYLGSSFSPPKDPEHLPPKNRLQKCGNGLRAAPRWLRSEAVGFGVRVTVAVMSVMILAFLRQTHGFFIEQRGVWCCVMVVIGMSPTSGSAVFSLLGNLTFTLFGMVGAYINWYIVDQKTAGVIVVFFFFMMFYFYFCARFPRFLVAIVAGALTHVLVVGYELQVRVIGVEQATATGQLYYPLYKLAPYRLLNVGAGVLVAYIFTIFPVPITEASTLRRDLGLSFFLLSKYLSAVTATVDLRLSNRGDSQDKKSPARRLEKMRHKVLEKQLHLLGSMRTNLAFLPWDLRLGGEFPVALYREVVDEVQNITNYLTIISYATESFPSFHLPPPSPSSPQTAPTPWLTRFSHFRRTTTPEAHHLTTLLTLLSAALRNAQPLPPYLALGDVGRVSDELIDGGGELLELGHLDEPGFRAVAVVETGQRCVVRSVGRCVERVRDLVGEVDFSFRLVVEGEEKVKGA